MLSGCGSVVIASVAGASSGGGVDAFMLRRSSLVVVIGTGWSRTIYCISVSCEFEAGSTVSTAGVAVAGTSAAWTVAVALPCLVV